MSNDISKIDKNFSVETTLVKDGIYFYDVRREPFRVVDADGEAEQAILVVDKKGRAKLIFRAKEVAPEQ